MPDQLATASIDIDPELIPGRAQCRKPKSQMRDIEMPIGPAGG
jgi:hypothetical protein